MHPASHAHWLESSSKGDYFVGGGGVRPHVGYITVFAQDPYYAYVTIGNKDGDMVASLSKA